MKPELTVNGQPRPLYLSLGLTGASSSISIRRVATAIISSRRFPAGPALLLNVYRFNDAFFVIFHRYFITLLDRFKIVVGAGG